MILHIDMDAFFASIEQAVNPRLRGKPLIVGSRNNRRHTVVCAASYEAKAYGIDSGMPSAEAFKLCPDLEFVPVEQGKYIWTSEQIYQLLQGYEFEVVYASIDEFRMDIAHEPELLVLAQDIQNRIQETFKITASIGIAKNYLLAKLASKLNKPNGLVVLTEDNLAEILSKTPVKKLCGVGKNTEEILLGLGLKNCLDLYQKSAPFLEQNLGRYGLSLYLSLHSRESFSAQEKEAKPKSVGHSYTLPRATENPGFIQAWLRFLSEMVAERLRLKNLISRTLNLWLNGPEMGNFRAQETFQQATNDGFELYHRCLKIMAKLGQETPKIRALGVVCSSLLSQAYSQPLFKEQERREELIKAIDKINACHGEDTIYPAVVSLVQKMPTDSSQPRAKNLH